MPNVRIQQLQWVHVAWRAMQLPIREVPVVPVILLALLFVPECLAEEPPLEKLALSGHRAACESIRTFTCEFKVEGPAGRPPVSGHYWRKGPNSRSTYYVDDATHDVLIRDGRVRVFVNGRSPAGVQRHGASVRAGDFAMPYDVWVRALLAVPTFAQHEPRFQLAHEALGDPAASTRFNHVREQGQTLIKARIKYAYASMEVLLDPDANYLVRRIHVKPVSENLSVTNEVTSFLEPVPGLFFPSGCVTRIGDTEEIRYTFSAVRINSPIADDRFKLVLPAETVTSDYLQGTVYRTDSDGNNLGPVRTPSGQPATLGAGTFGPTNGLETVDVSVTQVTSWRPYVVLLAALTLASAALLVFRGYRHRSSIALEKGPYGHLKTD